MRTSEAQRYARWSAVVATLLLAGVVGTYLRHAYQISQVEKKAPPSIPSTVEQQSADFTYSKVEGHQTVFTVRASRATAYKDGSNNLLEDVSISMYGRKGERNDSLITKACDFNSTSGGIICGGEVRMVLGPANAAPTDKNVIRVTTAKVTFNRDSGEAVTDDSVNFEWPSGKGTAVGASYSASTGTLSLAHAVQLDLLPPPRRGASPAPGATDPSASLAAAESGNKNLHLDGNKMVFSRDEHSVQVSGMVHAHQESHEIAAENLRLDLDAALHARHLVASGHPQLRDAEPTGMMTLDGNEISAALSAEGHIESIEAQGSAQGKVHLDRNTPSGVDQMDAGRVHVDLLPSQPAPRLLTASGGVVLTSRGQSAADSTRRIETDALELNFGETPGVKGTRVTSLNMLAPSQVETQANVVSNGSRVLQTTRMSGQRTSLTFDDNNRLRQLTSTGGVEVSRQTGNAPAQKTTSSNLTANFVVGEWSSIDQTGDVHFTEGVRAAQGTSAHIDHTSNAVSLSGPATLSDGTMRTTAKTVAFSQGSNELHADGNVVTTQIGSGASGLTNLSSAPGHISADHLLADPAHGRATYSGKARLWQGDSVIEADAIALDDASHSLVATGHVRGVFPQAPWSPKITPAAAHVSRPPAESSHVSGGTLTYWGAESRARLEPDAKVESPEGSMVSKQLDLYFSTVGSGSGTQQLQKAVATGNVTVQQQDRRGTANQATYTPDERKFVLSGGSPTLYDTTGDSTTGRELTFHFADDTIIIDSEEGSRTVTLHRVGK